MEVEDYVRKTFALGKKDQKKGKVVETTFPVTRSMEDEMEIFKSLSNLLKVFLRVSTHDALQIMTF